MIEPLSNEYKKLEQVVGELYSDPAMQQEGNYREHLKKLGDAGLIRYVAPVKQARDLCFLRFLIAKHSALGDTLFVMQGLGSHPIALAGSESQKQSYLPRTASGEWITAFAITEPQAGSDVGSLTTAAEKKGNGYVLNGKKTLISNAGIADYYTLFARTGEGSRGVTAFILDANTEGLQAHSMELMAEHPIGELELTDCWIPEEKRLGSEGEGLKLAYSTLDVFRSSVGAAATGMAQRAFEEAIAYAKQRRQFQKPLADFQAIQFKIAEMAQLLRASKLLVWDAATRKDEGAERVTLEAAIAKSFATESAQQIIDQSLQIHGGIGLLKGSITEKLYRDIRALRIYEGTTEVLKSIIAQHCLK